MNNNIDCIDYWLTIQEMIVEAFFLIGSSSHLAVSANVTISLPNSGRRQGVLEIRTVKVSHHIFRGPIEIFSISEMKFSFW